jgi:hypothetical protein
MIAYFSSFILNVVDLVVKMTENIVDCDDILSNLEYMLLIPFSPKDVLWKQNVNLSVKVLDKNIYYTSCNLLF